MGRIFYQFHQSWPSHCAKICEASAENKTQKFQKIFVITCLSMFGQNYFATAKNFTVVLCSHYVWLFLDVHNTEQLYAVVLSSHSVCLDLHLAADERRPLWRRVHRHPDLHPLHHHHQEPDPSRGPLQEYLRAAVSTGHEGPISSQSGKSEKRSSSSCYSHFYVASMYVMHAAM